MARHPKKGGHTNPAEPPLEETTEEGPDVPGEQRKKPTRKVNKRLGPRWNVMNGVYGDAVAPDFPKITPPPD